MTPGSAGASPAEPATYSGSFEITESTPTGTAYAVFSARDLAGNRGTEVETGGSFEIDTDGPAVTRLVMQPEHPIQNDEHNPVSVTVTIGLDEAMKSGEVPDLSYELSGPGRVPVAIAALTQVTPEGDEAQAWQSSFTLPADAGLNAVEMLSFAYQGVDDLENIGETVCADGAVASGDACGTSFQVYQGDLPALAAPMGLTAESLPSGKISLTWYNIPNAVGYQVYRKAPGESALTLLPQTSPFVTGLDYVDATPGDGLYTYAVASVRQENTQTAVSELRSGVQAAADATPPHAPQNLMLEIVPQGMSVKWDDPNNTGEPVTYTLYRSNTDITPENIGALTPIIPVIPAAYLTTGLVDPNPLSGESFYAITAQDATGNESPPSASVNENISLVPVPTLEVRQQDTDLPEISWSYSPDASITGFLLEMDGKEIPLSAAARSYLDTSYSGTTRRYAVTAEDATGDRSTPRSILLPQLRITLDSRSLGDSGSLGLPRIKRGVMKRNNPPLRRHGRRRHRRPEHLAQHSASPITHHVRLPESWRLRESGTPQDQARGDESIGIRDRKPLVRADQQCPLARPGGGIPTYVGRLQSRSGRNPGGVGGGRRLCGSAGSSAAHHHGRNHAEPRRKGGNDP